jgi:hypothetical protein
MPIKIRIAVFIPINLFPSFVEKPRCNVDYRVPRAAVYLRLIAEKAGF